jgi:hypothetical protein
LCFLCFIGLWKKRKHSGSLGLNGREFGKKKLEEDQEGAGVCEGNRAQDTCDRAHQRSSDQEEDQTHLHSHAKEGDRSQCDRLQLDGDRAHLCVKPKPTAALFWKFLIFRVFVNPCCTRIQTLQFLGFLESS